MTYIYHIDENPAGFTSKLAADLKWTTEPPTVEGWYWAFDGEPRIAEVFYSYGNQLCADFTDENIPTPLDKLPEYTHWLGPLPVPEPPTEEK